MSYYRPTVSIGKCTFLNAREAHVYALSTAKDRIDYTRKYLEAAGPQLLLVYGKKYICLCMVYLFGYAADMVMFELTQHIRKTVPMARYNLSPDHIPILARNLGLPRIYGYKYCSDLLPIIKSNYDYIDNNLFARELLLAINAPEVLHTESNKAPTNWCFPPDAFLGETFPEFNLNEILMYCPAEITLAGIKT